MDNEQPSNSGRMDWLDTRDLQKQTWNNDDIICLPKDILKKVVFYLHILYQRLLLLLFLLLSLILLLLLFVPRFIVCPDNKYNKFPNEWKYFHFIRVSKSNPTKTIELKNIHIRCIEKGTPVLDLKLCRKFNL